MINCHDNGTPRFCPYAPTPCAGIRELGDLVAPRLAKLARTARRPEADANTEVNH